MSKANFMKTKGDLVSKGYSNGQITRILNSYGKSLGCEPDGFQFFRDICEMIQNDKEFFVDFLKHYKEEPNRKKNVNT